MELLHQHMYIFIKLDLNELYYNFDLYFYFLEYAYYLIPIQITHYLNSVICNVAIFTWVKYHFSCDSWDIQYEKKKTPNQIPAPTIIINDYYWMAMAMAIHYNRICWIVILSTIDNVTIGILYLASVSILVSRYNGKRKCQLNSLERTVMNDVSTLHSFFFGCIYSAASYHSNESIWMKFFPGTD